MNYKKTRNKSKKWFRKIRRKKRFGCDRIYLDNNVLNPLIRDKTYYQRFFKNMPEYSTAWTHHFRPIMAPFLLLELVGIRKFLPNEHEIRAALKTSQLKRSDLAERYLHIKHTVQNLVRNNNKIEFNHIISKMKDSLNHLHTEGSKYLQTIIEKIEENPQHFQSSVIESIVDDRIQMYFDSEIENVATFSFLEKVDSIYSNSNKSFFRSAFRNISHLLKSDQINESDKKKIRKLIKTIKIDHSGDLVDTQLIHFASVGYSHKYGFGPVLCVTEDAPEVVMNRVEAYLQVLDFSLSQYHMHYRYRRHGKDVPSPGTILFFKKGDMVLNYKVRKLSE